MKSEFCIWTGQDNFFGDFIYRTECERVMNLQGSTFDEEEYKFCPYCGKKIKDSEK